MGLPAKSGVSGAVLLVVPNVMGIMCWSPPLDRVGNSVRGIHFCQVCRQEEFQSPMIYVFTIPSSRYLFSLITLFFDISKVISMSYLSVYIFFYIRHCKFGRLKKNRTLNNR